MSKHVVVVGGGIIGLCSAYFLRKEGHRVTVVDQSNMDGGASYVNAGYVSPSHIIPLSAPGVMKKGLKWMLNPSSPLYIKPRLDLDFLRWTLAFNKSCNKRHVTKAIPIIKELALSSQLLYERIKQEEQFNFHYEKKGLLMLCQSEKMLKEEIHTANLAKDEGLDAREISLSELNTMEPDVEIDALGATYYKCDAHTTPGEFMHELIENLKAKGVEISCNEKVSNFHLSSSKIQAVVTENRTINCDEVVLATGSWTSDLSRKFGLKLLLQAGKGYRINTERPTGIRLPAILTEAKAAVTPMNGFTRFAGTMEIAGINSNINTVRVESIANAVNRYYPNVKITSQEKGEARCGLRPVSPDGLPYIGRPLSCPNLVVATGHAMMGWTMGPTTGKLVSEIISDKTPSMSLERLHPNRRF